MCKRGRARAGLSLPGSLVCVCARAPECVCGCVCVRASGGVCVCVCQREGALWVRQCCVLSEGTAAGSAGREQRGRVADRHPSAGGLPPRGLGTREGHSRPANLAGLHRIFILGGEPFTF